jgi:pectinesterase
MKTVALTILLCLTASAAAAAAPAKISAGVLNGKPDEWFTSDESKQFITNIISFQGPEGGWAKYYNADHPRKEGESLGDWNGVGTIDNKYTYTEIRFLARAYNLTKRQDVLGSFNRGIDFLLKMQYESGGFPQRYPPPDNYGQDITFNDDAMTNVMRLLEDIGDGAAEFDFLDADRRAKVKQAFARGIDCILKTQITTPADGILTGWAQQYDPDTLQPAKARAYELPAIAAGESASIVELLMRLDHPTPEQIKAVHAAAAWFEKSKLTGKRLDKIKDAEGKSDVVLVDDPSATEPLWSRYYEIETNRPFFCGRDGVKKYFLAEIERERRIGYAWIRPFGRRVLADYPKWCAKHKTKPQ